MDLNFNKMPGRGRPDESGSAGYDDAVHKKKLYYFPFLLVRMPHRNNSYNNNYINLQNMLNVLESACYH